MGTVAVAGGTGTLGRHVVRSLVEADAEPRVISRRPRPAGRPLDHEWAVVDYGSGAGLADALRGVDTIVVATSALRDSEVVRSIAQEAARGTHLVYISIVGIDDIPMPYYAQKVKAEAAVQASGLPWTILRATQFHSLARAMARAITAPPVALIPKGTSIQPIAAAEVGARLARLAGEPAAGRVDDMGGPEILTADELVRTYLDATGRHRKLVPVSFPGKMMRALATGANLTPEHRDGTQTFADFLASAA